MSARERPEESSQPQVGELCEYATPDGHGNLYFVDEDEYIQAERSGRGVTLIWTASESVNDVFRSVRELFGEPPARARGQIYVGGERSDGGPIGISGIDAVHAPETRSDVTMITVRYPDFLVGWREPVQKFERQTHAMAECVVLFDRSEPAELRTFIEQTATPHVAKQTHEVLGSLALLSAGR